MSLDKRSVILSVGHYRKKRGANNAYFGLSEWQLCGIFVSGLSDDLINRGVYCISLTDHTLKQKVEKINIIQPEIAIEFHMNSFDTTCDGHLCMYWVNSFFGEKLSILIRDSITVNKKRENIAVKKHTTRGSYFLRKTKCIALIVELCFIDNDEDVIRTVGNYRQLRSSIVMALQTFFRRYSIPVIKRSYDC